MPLYRIETKGSDKLRLIDATSARAAIAHAAAGMFVASRVTKPTDSARLMSTGVKLETAGEVADEPESDAERVDIESGMVVRGPASAAEVVRNATLAELAEATGNACRVNASAGMVQVHVGGGADDDDANWSDIREATGEELSEAGPPDNAEPQTEKPSGRRGNK